MPEKLGAFQAVFVALFVAHELDRAIASAGPGVEEEAMLGRIALVVVLLPEAGVEHAVVDVEVLAPPRLMAVLVVGLPPLVPS